jgi:hypothetical protein
MISIPDADSINTNPGGWLQRKATALRFPTLFSNVHETITNELRDRPEMWAFCTGEDYSIAPVLYDQSVSNFEETEDSGLRRGALEYTCQDKKSYFINWETSGPETGFVRVARSPSNTFVASYQGEKSESLFEFIDEARKKKASE